MQVKQLTNFVFLTSAVLIISCGQAERKTENVQKEPNKDSIDSIQSKQQNLRQDTVVNVHNYSDWNEFWKVFQKAASKKDSLTITALTNFPFLQNAELMTRDDFMEHFVVQVYGFKKSYSPVEANDHPLQINNENNVDFPKLDSIKYTNFNGKDFYFAKVNGFYKLVQIVTPG